MDNINREVGLFPNMNQPQIAQQIQEFQAENEQIRERFGSH
jgi:hypothetical protein